MTPDPLTPEERAAHGRVGTPSEQYGDSKILAAALDRLAPKPAAEKEPLNFAGPIFLAPNAEGYINAFPGSGSVYVRNNQQVAVEVTAKRLEFPSAPDPDREAREALSAAKQHPQWYGAGLTGRLAALRAHGFTHRSEGAQTPNAEVVRLLREWEADLRWQAKQAHDRQPPEPELELAYQNKADALEGAAYRFADLVPSPAPPPAAVDVVREALVERCWSNAALDAQGIAAALAARGVTFGGKA